MNASIAGQMNTGSEVKRRGIFMRWVVLPIRTQLTQGVSPRRLAWAVTAGSVLGIFPIIGSTSLLTTAAGLGARLNQPVLHAFKTMVIPLQWLMLPVFVRIGEGIFQAPPVRFNIPDLIQKFGENPGAFMRQFGMTGVHGIVAWTVLAPLMGGICFFVTWPILERAAKRLRAPQRGKGAGS
jgi:hypothetical protein